MSASCSDVREFSTFLVVAELFTFLAQVTEHCVRGGDLAVYGV